MEYSKEQLEKRINEKGLVYCNYGNHWASPEEFYIIKDKKYLKLYYTALCKNCKKDYNNNRNEELRLGVKADDFTFWRIEIDEDSPENIKKVLTIMGYDTEKDIHQQFLEKHPNLKLDN